MIPWSGSHSLLSRAACQASLCVTIALLHHPSRGNTVLLHECREQEPSRTALLTGFTEDAAFIQTRATSGLKRSARKTVAANKTDNMEGLREEALHSLFGLPQELTPRVSSLLQEISQELPANTSIAQDASLELRAPQLEALDTTKEKRSHQPFKWLQRKPWTHPWHRAWGNAFLDGTPIFKDLIVLAIVVCAITLGVVICGKIIGRGAPPNGVDGEDDDEFETGNCVDPEDYATFSARKRQRLFLCQPHSSPGAFVWSIFMDVTIIMSLLAMFAQSFHVIAANYPIVFAALEWFFLVAFLGEWIAMIMCARDLYEHFQKGMTYIDFLAAFPSILDCCFDADMLGNKYNAAKMVRILRLTRLFRLFKLFGNSKQVHVIFAGVAASIPAFFASLSIIVSAILVPGALMFFLEQGEWDEASHCYRRILFDGKMEEGCSPFQNMGASIYWATTTVSTVGYGDITPVTLGGKIVCIISMITCIILMTFPIAMISSAFTLAVDEMKEKEKKEKSRKDAYQQEHTAPL